MTHPLTVLRPGNLPSRPAESRWLVENLWTDRSVGLVGGAPKSLKTFMALELALSVSTGTPCLGRFGVPRQGPVLLYAAEDSAGVIRERLESLARAHGASFDDLDMGIIDCPMLRIDQREMQQRLHATLKKYRPALLVLDPFVRLSRVDENCAREVASVLGYLRALQRHHDLSILVVHHARKSPAAAPGHSLRGSSDFFAWGDCFLYMARQHDSVRLTVEHRAAPSIDPVYVTLSGDPPSLLLCEPQDPAPAETLDRRILGLLEKTQAPMTTRQIQQAVHARTERVLQVLRDLHNRKLLARHNGGWVLSAFPDSRPGDLWERKRQDSPPQTDGPKTSCETQAGNAGERPAEG